MDSDRKSKKRSRGTIEKIDVPEQEKRSKLKTRSPLKNKVVGVSSLMGTSKDDTQDTYRSLVDLCEKFGGKVASQIHRKLFCVIATDTAIERRTQRVRKAWKLGIPLLNIKWLHDGCPNDIEAYLVEQTGDLAVKPLKGTSRDSGDRSDPEKDTNTEIHSTEEIHIDLGCCCVCHEGSEADALACEWCKECSVNKPTYS